MMKYRFFSLFITAFTFLSVAFATDGVTTSGDKNCRYLFNHLDLGVTLGTTGIGVDVTMPILEQLDVRAGVSYMPEFDVPLHLGISSYAGASQSTLNTASEVFSNLTGYKIGDRVTVNGRSKMFTAKLLVDFYPLKNAKQWHVTAGVYFGPENVATAVNDIDEMTTLVSLGMYNAMYDFFVNERYWDQPIYQDIYVSPSQGDKLATYFKRVGEMGAGLGTFNKTMYYDLATKTYSPNAPATGTEGVDYVVYKVGDRYLMKPHKENGTMSADAYANVVRPYLGVGYNSRFGNDDKFSIGFDFGAMFWGGSPDVVTHEGVDLINDVDDIGGKVGDYVKISKSFKVYPVLNFKIAYNIF